MHTAHHKQGFAPVADARTRVLILGSLPSDRSLASGQYYGNPQNQFWSLLGDVLDTELRALAYEARLQTLRAHGIGLWDVVAAAERPGSLDSSMRGAAANDLAAFAAGLPALAAIAFNGGTAARLGRRQFAPGVAWALLDLPSSSAAHTVSYSAKLARWLELRALLRAPGKTG
jgi:hypoxanthine-DNA glycosylase